MGHAAEVMSRRSKRAGSVAELELWRLKIKDKRRTA
jgi:hypothetical protein